MSTEEAIKAEIARLTGAINRHKAGALPKPYFAGRNNTYVHPNYKPPSRPSSAPNSFPSEPLTQIPVASTSITMLSASTNQAREVVIDGVAFQSSGRSLVRKERASSFASDCRMGDEEVIGNPSFFHVVAKAEPSDNPPFKPTKPIRTKYPKTFPSSRSTRRPYKPTTSLRVPRNQNMTLTNGRKPVRMGRKSVKSMKYVDKQCPRFSTTGLCSSGRTCLYKHDPSKIAICWPFLQGNCPNTAETCSLSHDPTPERTPLCVHFANNGRCMKGENCLFPHVHVGPRSGVCRDFAVLGYCDKGVDCDKQHVRECPDFAEKGTCPNPKCKLPHVIRANKRRADATAASSSSKTPASATASASSPNSEIGSAYTDPLPATPLPPTGDSAKIGDEYISLTFLESESDESDEEDEDDEMNSDEEDEDKDVDLQAVDNDECDD